LVTCCKLYLFSIKLLLLRIQLLISKLGSYSLIDNTRVIGYFYLLILL
jgi:hypothetical protein